MPMRDSWRWKYQASMSGKAIFMSSEGWKRPMPRFSQRRDPFTTVPLTATAQSSSTVTAYSGTAARASCCGGMLATIHISTSAKHSDAAWLVTRATLWSVAENNVTSPMPAVASAADSR